MALIVSQWRLVPLALSFAIAFGAAQLALAAEPTAAQVRAGIDRAATFFHDRCAKHGGYVWRYSRDFKLSEGEAETGPDTIWVQPPGTPAVGMAFVAAYDATGERKYLDWAVEAAEALLAGQMQTGGWDYGIHFAAADRAKYGYRDNPRVRPKPGRRNETCKTILDDDTTPAALRFLMRVDQRLQFQHARIHEAVQFSLEALARAQYPNGGWSHNWSEVITERSPKEFPVLNASYPETWSRKWLNDWPGRYYTNDNIAGNMAETYLEAWSIYQAEQYRQAAIRTGEFLLRAQMPQPQPAWAQQYDIAMHPCWDRKFEPPAISAHESEEVCETLLLLYRRTGESRFLEAAGRALPYLQKSRRSDGRVDRFLELQTNRPLYFTTDYQLTYSEAEMPTHYGFIQPSRLTEIAAEFDRLTAQGVDAPAATIDRAEAARTAAEALAGLSPEGGWLSPRGMKGFRKASPDGVYESQVFIDRLDSLCRYLTSIDRR